MNGRKSGVSVMPTNCGQRGGELPLGSDTMWEF
jgi:hypothetical protein